MFSNDLARYEKMANTIKYRGKFNVFSINRVNTCDVKNKLTPLLLLLYSIKEINGKNAGYLKHSSLHCEFYDEQGNLDRSL